MISMRIKNGDRKAFEELFHSYYVPLCRFAFKDLKDQDEAEEIVQDTYVNFWRRRTEINVEASLKSYLFTAVRNGCLNHLKHEGVVRAHAQHMIHQQDNSSEIDEVVTEELAARINSAVESMPDQRRRIFRMSRDEGMRYREIADHLQISVKTVENHMGKALQYLREQLSDFLVLLIYFIINNIL